MGNSLNFHSSTTGSYYQDLWCRRPSQNTKSVLKSVFMMSYRQYRELNLFFHIGCILVHLWMGWGKFAMNFLSLLDIHWSMECSGHWYVHVEVIELTEFTSQICAELKGREHNIDNVGQTASLQEVMLTFFESRFTSNNQLVQDCRTQVCVSISNPHALSNQEPFHCSWREIIDDLQSSLVTFAFLKWKQLSIYHTQSAFFLKENHFEIPKGELFKHFHLSWWLLSCFFESVFFFFFFFWGGRCIAG